MGVELVLEENEGNGWEEVEEEVQEGNDTKPE